MTDGSPAPAGLVEIGGLTVGIVAAPIGWLLVVFAVGTRCHPDPCPSPPVTMAFLGIALVGTLALGIGGSMSVWRLLKTRTDD